MNITIGRYDCPSQAEREATPEGVSYPADTWESYIEPEDRQVDSLRGQGRRFRLSGLSGNQAVR